MNLRIKNIKRLDQGVSKIFMATGHTAYCGLARGQHVDIHGLPMRLNYCVIFVVRT
jgi:hypothetical protein